MALKSDELSFELAQRLQDEADELSLELDGKVSLVQSKDGVVLLKDEIPGHLVLEVLRNFVENAICEKIDAEERPGIGVVVDKSKASYTTSTGSHAPACKK